MATIDNLGRSQAPSTLWPVHPTPGRFAVDEAGGSSAIGVENAARYTPLVLLAETIDVGKTADLNERRLKKRLAEFRDEIIKRARR